MNEDLIEMLEDAIRLLERHQWVSGEDYQFHGDGMTRQYIKCSDCFSISWGTQWHPPTRPVHTKGCKIAEIIRKLGDGRLRTHLLLM